MLTTSFIRNYDKKVNNKLFYFLKLQKNKIMFLLQETTAEKSLFVRLPSSFMSHPWLLCFVFTTVCSSDHGLEGERDHGLIQEMGEIKIYSEVVRKSINCFLSTIRGMAIFKVHLIHLLVHVGFSVVMKLFQ